MKVKLLISSFKKNNNNFHLLYGFFECSQFIEDVEIVISEYQSLLYYVNSFNPDIILFFGEEDIDLELVALLRQKLCAKLILWTTEDPFEIVSNSKRSHYFDAVFTSDLESQKLYKHNNCYHLPLAASREIFYRPIIQNYSDLMYDVVFIGTAWPERCSFITDLINSLKRHNLKYRFLMPQNPFVPKEYIELLPIREFEREVKLSPKNVADLQNLSLVSLVLFRSFSGDLTDRPQSSPTNRFYETALSGTYPIFLTNSTGIINYYPSLKNYFISLCTESPVDQVCSLILELKSNILKRNSESLQIQDYLVRDNYKSRIDDIIKITINS